MLKEIQTSKKEKLEHLHSSCRENQLIYQIPTWVSHEGIQRSEPCLNLLGNPVKKYIPFMSQHENCSFNRCYCLAEHKTRRIKRKLKRSKDQTKKIKLKRSNSLWKFQWQMKRQQTHCNAIFSQIWMKDFWLGQTLKQFALGRLWHLHSQRYSELNWAGF